MNLTTQVIMITRLYAMYQRSRKMLVFIVVTFLAVTIACGIIAAVGSSYLTWGRLLLLMKDESYQAYLTNARGARARWQPPMFSQGRGPSSDNHSLGNRYYVGDPRALSCGLDRCKTPS
jgi:hypothetical protein